MLKLIGEKNAFRRGQDVVQSQVTSVTTGLWHCEIELIRLEFSTTKHVCPKSFHRI
jgi:hypothetical protein